MYFTFLVPTQSSKERNKKTIIRAAVKEIIKNNNNSCNSSSNTTTATTTNNYNNYNINSNNISTNLRDVYLIGIPLSKYNIKNKTCFTNKHDYFKLACININMKFKFCTFIPDNQLIILRPKIVRVLLIGNKVTNKLPPSRPS